MDGPASKHTSLRVRIPVWAKTARLRYVGGSPRYYELFVVEPGASISLLGRSDFPMGFARHPQPRCSRLAPQ
jgi:hypothetical protein